MGIVFCIAQFNATEGNKESLGKKLLELQSMNKEEGCNFYIPCTDIIRNDLDGTRYDFTFVEQFRSEEDFNLHLQEKYVKDFFDQNDHLISDKNISLLKLLGRN